MEEQERLQQQVDGYKRELAQRVERIQRLEATRDDLLGTVSHLQIQMKQDRDDSKHATSQNEELQRQLEVLNKKSAEQRNKIKELQDEINKLQSKAMVCRSRDTCRGVAGR